MTEPTCIWTPAYMAAERARASRRKHGAIVGARSHCVRPGCSNPLRWGLRYCGRQCAGLARTEAPPMQLTGVPKRRNAQGNLTTSRVKFTPALWDQWQADRAIDARTLELREGIAHMRRTLR